MGTIKNRLEELEAHCVAHDEPTNPAAAWVLRYDKLELLVKSEREGWRYANELEQERKCLQEIADAAQNMCRVKGRHHSELAMQRLMLACGFELPNVQADLTGAALCDRSGRAAG